MESTEQQVPRDGEESIPLTPAQRSAAIKDISALLCRQSGFLRPTKGLEEYVEEYVDLRERDHKAASAKYPATEQAIKRPNRRTNLGGWGVQHGMF
jgi:hypothetical protein